MPSELVDGELASESMALRISDADTALIENYLVLLLIEDGCTESKNGLAVLTKLLILLTSASLTRLAEVLVTAAL